MKNNKNDTGAGVSIRACYNKLGGKLSFDEKAASFSELSDLLSQVEKPHQTRRHTGTNKVSPPSAERGTL